MEHHNETSLLLPMTPQWSADPSKGGGRGAAAEVSDVSSVHSMDIGDDAIPQVIILIETFWGYVEDEDEHLDADAFGICDCDQQQQQTSLPSEATIQVVKNFFDGIEDQMDVEDELLLERPEDIASIVSDLSPATSQSSSSSDSTSSSSFQGWIPRCLLEFDEDGNS